jgi:MinD superfamily P-loop ATPase
MRYLNGKKVGKDMIISVASGKGGTGKTTIATSLALSLENVQFLDCDVEEPNAHIFLKPDITERIPVGIPVPEIDESKCNYCGKCAQLCEFNALVVLKEKILFFPELCHGCGGCSYICPEKAIKEVTREIGVIEKGTSNGMDFSHGVLNVGEPMAPPLIKQVKNLITDPEKITIVDASPGTSCPVVETVKGTDFCLLVTEPTPFGLNDLKLAVEMLRKLAIPFGVVINCADIGNKEVEWYCEHEGIPIVMTIPWDRRIAEAYSTGIPLQKALPDFKDIFSQLYKTLERLVEK